MPEKNVGTYANKYFSGYSPLGSLIDNEMKKEFWLLQSFCKRIRCHTDSSALAFSHKENQVSSKFGGFTLSPRSRRQPSEGGQGTQALVRLHFALLLLLLLQLVTQWQAKGHTQFQADCTEGRIPLLFFVRRWWAWRYYLFRSPSPCRYRRGLGIVRAPRSGDGVGASGCRPTETHRLS